jgi:hypothetical protein
VVEWDQPDLEQGAASLHSDGTDGVIKCLEFLLTCTSYYIVQGQIGRSWRQNGSVAYGCQLRVKLLWLAAGGRRVGCGAGFQYASMVCVSAQNSSIN